MAEFGEEIESLEDKISKAYAEIPARMERLIERDRERGRLSPIHHGRLLADDPAAKQRLEDRMRQRITQDFLRKEDNRRGGRRWGPYKSMTTGAAPPQVYSEEEQFGGFARAEPEDLSRFSKDPLEDVREYRRSTGDVPEYYGKDDAASRRALFEGVRGGMSGVLSGPEVKTAREYATASGISPEQFDMTLRRELFEQVKGRAAEKKLSPTQFGRYRESATALGVTPEQFDTAFSKAGITSAVGEGLTFDGAVAGAPDGGDDDALVQEHEAFLAKQDKELAAPVEDQAARQAAAAQKVMGARGIEKQKAMQSDDYVLGSGSALRQTPRELGTFSGAMNRAGRRLQRKGAWGEAQKMFGGAEVERMNEGSRISTPQRRARKDAEQRRQADLMAKEQEQFQQMMADWKKRQTSNIGTAGSPTSPIKQSSRNR